MDETKSGIKCRDNRKSENKPDRIRKTDEEKTRMAFFGSICSANSKRLNEELKGKYPLTDEMLVNLADSFSYLNIVQDEEARESKIFDLMIQYGKQIIHPILVELGYVKNDRMNN